MGAKVTQTIDRVLADPEKSTLVAYLMRRMSDKKVRQGTGKSQGELLKMIHDMQQELGFTPMKSFRDQMRPLLTTERKAKLPKVRESMSDLTARVLDGEDPEAVVEGIVPTDAIDAFLADLAKWKPPINKGFPGTLMKFFAVRLSNLLQKHFPEFHDPRGSGALGKSAFQVDCSIPMSPLVGGDKNHMKCLGAKSSAPVVASRGGSPFEPPTDTAYLPPIQVTLAIVVSDETARSLQAAGITSLSTLAAWVMGKISKTRPDLAELREKLLRDITDNWPSETYPFLHTALGHEMTHVLQFDSIAKRGRQTDVVLARAAAKYQPEGPGYFKDQFETGAYAEDVARQMFEAGLRLKDLKATPLRTLLARYIRSPDAIDVYDPNTPEGKRFFKHVFLYMERFEKKEAAKPKRRKKASA
jgi:hypothetical protein